jgi:hypothetical protein
VSSLGLVQAAKAWAEAARGKPRPRTAAQHTRRKRDGGGLPALTFRSAERTLDAMIASVRLV